MYVHACTHVGMYIPYMHTDSTHTCRYTCSAVETILVRTDTMHSFVVLSFWREQTVAH